MFYTITNEQINALICRYEDNCGGTAYQIPGTLNDNYIIVAPGYKAQIIRERYLNDWSSCNTIKSYNKLPKKYARIINLMEQGEIEEAENLFFN